MNSFPFPSLPADVNPVAGIVRCIRRICLLREQGSFAEAKHLEQSELADAIRDVRLVQGVDALPESELHSLFVQEEKRVADAVVLSALLIPELVKSFPSSSSNPPLAQAGSASPFAQNSAIPFPRPPSAAASGVTPGIADMLDSMLSSERTARQS